MFSQASVSHSVHRGWVSLVPCPFRGMGVDISGHRSLGGGWVCPREVDMFRGTQPRQGPEKGGYPPPTDTEWWPPHVQLASMWYTYYWNAFFL